VDRRIAHTFEFVPTASDNVDANEPSPRQIGEEIREVRFWTTIKNSLTFFPFPPASDILYIGFFLLQRSDNEKISPLLGFSCPSV
jgi:hypothetical protein